MAKNPLCVIACHFNPCGYRKPVENFNRFRSMLRSSGVPLYSVELAYHGDQFSLPCTWCDERVRGDRERSTLFQKEALLNTVIDRVADKYDAIAWVDADVIFTNPRWPREAMVELEMYPVVQLFSQANITDYDGEIISSAKSTGFYYSVLDERWRDFSQAHPGFAWAARSDVLKRCKLYPYMITGCGDSAMLRAFTNDDHAGCPGFDDSIGKSVAGDLKKWAQRWDAEAGESGVIMSFVLGGVVHMWHGDLRDRQNAERRYWMREVNVETDLRINDEGLVEWTDFALRNKKRLVSGVAEYFVTRKEDCK